MNQPRGSIWLSDTLNEAHLDTTVACCARSAGRSLFPPWKEFPGLVARCWLTGVDSCGIFRVILFGKRCGTMRILDHFGSLRVWRNHGKAMFCKVGLLTWKIAALPLIRVVFWMRHSPDQQELENSYERLVFILWATVALCQRNIAYRYIRCWFDAGSIRRVHLIYIWELTSNYMKTMVSWCFLTVLP